MMKHKRTVSNLAYRHDKPGPWHMGYLMNQLVSHFIVIKVVPIFQQNEVNHPTSSSNVHGRKL